MAVLLLLLLLLPLLWCLCRQPPAPRAGGLPERAPRRRGRALIGLLVLSHTPCERRVSMSAGARATGAMSAGRWRSGALDHKWLRARVPVAWPMPHCRVLPRGCAHHDGRPVSSPRHIALALAEPEFVAGPVPLNKRCAKARLCSDARTPYRETGATVGSWEEDHTNTQHRRRCHNDRGNKQARHRLGTRPCWPSSPLDPAWSGPVLGDLPNSPTSLPVYLGISKGTDTRPTKHPRATPLLHAGRYEVPGPLRRPVVRAPASLHSTRRPNAGPLGGPRPPLARAESEASKPIPYRANHATQSSNACWASYGAFMPCLPSWEA